MLKTRADPINTDFPFSEVGPLRILRCFLPARQGPPEYRVQYLRNKRMCEGGRSSLLPPAPKVSLVPSFGGTVQLPRPKVLLDADPPAVSDHRFRSQGATNSQPIGSFGKALN